MLLFACVSVCALFSTVNAVKAAPEGIDCSTTTTCQLLLQLLIFIMLSSVIHTILIDTCALEYTCRKVCKNISIIITAKYLLPNSYIMLACIYM